MKEIFVFGHRNPDTDSVCSSIALAHLKKQLGFNVVPKILSDINKETTFVLDYFNVSLPTYLNDVKIRIKDVSYEKGVFINKDASIYAAFSKMNKYNTTAIPLVDDKEILTGYVTLKEIAKYLTVGNKQLVTSTLNNIIEVLDGEIITSFKSIIEGNVLVAGLQTSTITEENRLSENDILVVGDRPRIIEHAIKSNVSLIVITCDNDISDELVKLATANNVTIIKTAYDSFNVANHIGTANFIDAINVNFSPVVVHDEDYFVDFKEKMHKINHTNYPVVNKKGKCLGLIRLTGDNAFEKKEVILVDHNSFSQSVVGLEEANIVEIIDHHNLGAIGTNSPINFRSMPVGCTSTIITKMYGESKVDIPKDIAGLMLSAILSDTLLFTSPTTTQKDKEAAEILAKIADVDPIVYGKEMFKAASSIEGMSIKDLVYADFKAFNLGEKQLGLSQITTMDFEGMSSKISEIVEYLNIKVENGFDLSVLFVTDIIKNGSHIIYDDNSVDIVKDAFSLNEIHQGIFVEGLVSRKKQMLPNLLETMQEL